MPRGKSVFEADAERAYLRCSSATEILWQPASYDVVILIRYARQIHRHFIHNAQRGHR